MRTSVVPHGLDAHPLAEVTSGKGASRRIRVAVMKLDWNGPWPILLVVLLFLAIPVSTLPGLFDAGFALVLVIGGVLALAIVGALLQRQRS